MQTQNLDTGTQAVPATTSYDQRLNYVAASHAHASQSSMHAYIHRLCQLLPYNSSTQQQWEVFQVSRVLIKNIERTFDLDCPRDIQDFFVLILRQRAQDAEIKMRIEMLAGEMLANERFAQTLSDEQDEQLKFDADLSYAGESAKCGGTK